MLTNSPNPLIDEYEGAIAQHGIYSREARIAADAVRAAGLEVPSYTANLVQGQSALRFQRVSEQLAEQERISEAEKDKYPKTGGRLLKRPMSALERDWYDSVERYGESDPRSRKLGLEVTTKRLSPFTEESAIPFMRMATGDTGLFAPPPKSLEEREGGLLDTLISPLLLGERASGTALYALRKKLGLGGIDWIEQAEEGEMFKEITPSMALGFTTRETDLFTARGVAGLAIDIVLDPTTYLGIGLIGKAGKLAKAMKIADRAGEAVTVGKEAIEMLGKHTDDVRKAFPHISIEDARKIAEEEVFDIVKKNPELLAAKKYVEPSLHFRSHKIAYTAPAKQFLGKVWRAAPLLQKRRALVESIRTGFTPYHKVRQAAGEQAAEVFAKFYRATEYQRGEWGKRASKLANKRPWFVKKSTEDEFNKEVRQYLERGVVPDDPRALKEAFEIRKGYDEMFDKEVAAGLIEREQFNPEYMYRILTPKAKKFLKEELGSDFKEGEEAYAYVRKLESAHKRTYEGTIDEMNERMLIEHNIDEFFVADPLKAYFLRGVESSRAIESHKLNIAIKTGSWTKPVEELSPVAGRTTPKFTADKIAEKADARYGGRIEKLRKQLGIPDEAKVTTIDDMMQYAQREGADEALLKSIDDQIAATKARIEAGVWRTTDEGVLGVRPEGMTITKAHITDTGKKAQESLVDLGEQRQKLLAQLETPYATEFESVEDVMQALASGRGYDIAKMRYVPKEMTVTAKEAQKRADRYRDAIQPFYDIFDAEKLRKGTLTEGDIKAVEQAISAEKGGLFKGMRYGKADLPISEYMELHGLKSAREVVYQKKQVDTSEQLIQQYISSIEKSHTGIAGKKEAIAISKAELYTRTFGAEHAAIAIKESETRLADELSSLLRLETDLSDEQARLVTSNIRYEKATVYMQETKFDVMADVVEPAKRKISHQETLVRGGTTTSLDWGVGLPTDIGALPPTVSPMKWAVHAAERIAIQKRIDKLDVSIAAKKVVIGAQTKPAVESATYKKLVDETADLVETREQIVKFYADYSSFSPEELATEARRMSKLPGITGEDKKLFADISVGVKLLDEQASEAKYVEGLKTETRVATPKEEVMVRNADGSVEPWVYEKDFGTYMPKALKTEIEETVPVENMWTHYYDPAMSLIRKGYIGYWPAFYVRNIYSAAWQNMYRRVSVDDYASAIATKYGPGDALIDLGPVYGKVPAKELKEMMERQGVTGQIGFVDVPEAFMETGAIGGVSLTKGIQTAETSMQFAMKTTEDLARMPLYIRTMRQGGSPEQAAETVRRFQFEYGAAGLTTFEKRKMKRLFLFYTWFRKNIPLQSQMLMEQPGTFAAAFKTREMMITPEEYNELPDWAKEGFAVGGSGNDRYYMMDVPLTDLPGLYGREELWFGVTPFVKMTIAMAVGYDPSTKVPLNTPEDWENFFANTLVGRYKSLGKEIERVGEGEIPVEDFAIHQLGGMYVGQYKGLSTKEAYKAARISDWKPSEEDYMAAFEAAGPMGAVHYEILWKPERSSYGEKYKKGTEWYENIGKNINIYAPPWDWNLAPWTWGEKDEFVGEEGILIGYNEEQMKAIEGHTLTGEQKEEVKRIYEEEGSEFAATYRTIMALEYHEARAALAGREPVSQTDITEAYFKLVARVGEEKAKVAKLRTFYTTEGKPHVITITEQEAEDWGDWRPPQELIDWLYPEGEEDIHEMSLDDYEQYIETIDPDYLLTPKERSAKQGREISWRLERASAKVKEIKASMEEGDEPTPELIEAEEELRMASGAMARYFGGEVVPVDEFAEFDKKYWEYYDRAVSTGEIKIFGEEGTHRQAMKFAELQTGVRPAISPTERERPAEVMYGKSEVVSAYDKKFYEYLDEAKKSGMYDIVSEEDINKFAAQYATRQTGIPSPEEHPTTRPLSAEIMKYLNDMYEDTGFVPTGAQMEWATREADGTVILSRKTYEEEIARYDDMGQMEYENLKEVGAIRPIRMILTDQLAIYEGEYTASQERERLMRIEYDELRKDPLGKMRSEKGISTILTMSYAVQNIDVRRSRMEEIENLMGTGVDR